LGSERTAGRRGVGALTFLVALLFLAGGSGVGVASAGASFESLEAAGSDGADGCGAVGAAATGAVGPVVGLVGGTGASRLARGIVVSGDPPLVPALSLAMAIAAAASKASPAITAGSLLPRCLIGGYVSSSVDGAGFAAAMTAATGAGAASGLLRAWPGIVWAMRARSSSLGRTPPVGASALITSPLITTAGVNG